MATFTIYGTEYEGATIGYRELCDMERRFHIQIADLGELQLNSIAAYIGISCRDIVDPYRAAEDYVIENGNFDAIISAMSEAMEESRFFKALQARIEKAEEEPKDEAPTTSAKKTRKKSAEA